MQIFRNKDFVQILLDKKTVEDGILHIKKLIPFCSVAQPAFFGWSQNLKAAFAPPKKNPQTS